MGHYPFTVFNGITLLVVALTIAVVWLRFRGWPASGWPLACYAVIVGYTIGFSGGLNRYWVAGGAACALAIRFGIFPTLARLVELLPLGYVAWRSVALLFMW